MSRIVPVKNTVLCVRIDEEDNVEMSGILVKDRKVDVFEVLDIASDGDIGIVPGDVITVDGPGDEVEFEGKPFVLFKTDHVSSKIAKKDKE